MSTESAQERGRLPSENEPGCKPKADVIGLREVRGDVAYLVRLREDWDTRISYHIKKMSDFVALHEALKAADEAATDPSMKVIQILPELPAAGSRFGIRRQLSHLGVGDFLGKQSEGVQNYLSTLMSQIPNTAADANVQAFFPDDPNPEHAVLLKELKLEAHSGVTLATIKGHWKVPGSDHVWTIDENGKALLDGKHRGTEYDLQESGSGLDLTVARPDGWTVDIDKSSKDHLFWSLNGQTELEWFRENDEAAQAFLKEVEAARAAAAAAEK